MKKLFLFLAMILALLFNSCIDDQVVDPVSSKDENTSLMYSQMSTNYINLTEEQITSIGVLHNGILADFVQTLPNGDVEDYFMNYEVDSLTYQIKELMMPLSYEDEIDFLNENFQNPEAMLIINSVLNDDYDNLEELHLLLTQKKSLAKNTLSDLDLDAVLVFLEVYESSASFWLSNPQYTSNPKGKITVKGLIGADGFGAAAGIMRFIYVAAPIAAAGGPIGVGMLVSTVGWGAAISSAGYLVANYH